jgi:hypothetical protein
LLALVSILLVAWFTVLTRDYVIGEGASNRLLNEGVRTRQWSDWIDDLRHADLLNPTTEWDEVRANFLLIKDRREALVVGRSIVRREPENLPGWVIVLKGSSGTNPRLASRARAEIRRLSPPVTRH